MVQLPLFPQPEQMCNLTAPDVAMPFIPFGLPVSASAPPRVDCGHDSKGVSHARTAGPEVTMDLFQEDLC